MHAGAHNGHVLRRSRPEGATGAFTLVEIVLVVAILATLAGLIISSLQGAETQATSNIALHELSQVREALLRFQHDTGFLPKCGPFALHPTDAVGSDPLGRVRLDLPDSKLPAEVRALSVADRIAWFVAGENLWQLYECSLPDSDPLALASTGRRGWRGPYLSQNSEARYGLTGLPPAPAVADAFSRATTVDWFSWSSSTEKVESLAQSRPIVLLEPASQQFARVVSFGPDGLYDPVGDPTPDDLVLFLFR